MKEHGYNLPFRLMVSLESTMAKEQGNIYSMHTYSTWASENRTRVHADLGSGLTDWNTLWFSLSDIHVSMKHLRVSHMLKTLNTHGVQLTIFWYALGRGVILQDNPYLVFVSLEPSINSCMVRFLTEGITEAVWLLKDYGDVDLQDFHIFTCWSYCF